MPVQPDYYSAGDWNAYCSRCGRKMKASQMRKQWQGYYVCPEDYEPRQPQDFVRGITENPDAPWSQNPADIFVSLGAYCTANGRSAVPGFAEPGCMIPGFVSPSFDPTITND